MRSVIFNPATCPLRQWEVAIETALSILFDELMALPADERPRYIHGLESTKTQLYVSMATETQHFVKRRVQAVPVLQWELGQVKNHRTYLLHHEPLLQVLNDRLEATGQAGE